MDIVVTLDILNEEECKQKLLCLFEEVYGKQYVGKIIVKKLDPEGYAVTLGLNNIDKPMLIMAELPDDKFLSFFREELRTKQLANVKYYTGYKTDFYDRR